VTRRNVSGFAAPADTRASPARLTRGMRRSPDLHDPYLDRLRGDLRPERRLRASGRMPGNCYRPATAASGCMNIRVSLAPRMRALAAAMAFAVVVRPCSAYRRLATSMLAVLRGCESTGLAIRCRSDGLAVSDLTTDWDRTESGRCAGGILSAKAHIRADLIRSRVPSAVVSRAPPVRLTESIRFPLHG
jgi:hypothetical protein